MTFVECYMNFIKSNTDLLLILYVIVFSMLYINLLIKTIKEERKK